MNVLLVEDDEAHAELIRRRLARTGKVRVTRASTASDALEAIESRAWELVLLDHSLPDGNGLELLSEIRRYDEDVPVIFLTAADSAEICARALKSGARDYLLKQRKYLDQLTVLLQSLFARPRAGRRETTGLEGLIGESRAMTGLRRSIRRAARSEATVLVEGETGTGKELVSRAVHRASRRVGGPWVAVNCAEIPDALFESEFFGNTRGAFTGAVERRMGIFESAQKGTLLLDEIEALAVSHQAKLLRVLQSREFKPVGASRPIPLDVRIIAASNRNLDELVRTGAFRKDLFYRLDVVRLKVPALRERTEDIPDLVSHFVAKVNARDRSAYRVPGAETLERLMRGSWPGNVRELENLVERACALSDGVLDEDLLVADLVDAVDSHRERVLEALRKHHWNRERSARELGWSRVTLWRHMTKLGIA